MGIHDCAAALASSRGRIQNIFLVGATVMFVFLSVCAAAFDRYVFAY